MAHPAGISFDQLRISSIRIAEDLAAHRELDIAKDFVGRTPRPVVPILDAGQDAESDRNGKRRSTR
jgi:hypothetical protein